MIVLATAKRSLATTILLSCSCSLFASFSDASQSSFHQKFGFNSENQFTTNLAGVWAGPQRTFTAAALSYARTPVPSSDQTDTFFQLAGAAGYSGDDIGFDFGLNASRAPLTKVQSFGGYFGLTYSYIRELDERPGFSAANQKRRRFMRYEAPETKAVFWARATYSGSSLKSTLLPPDRNAGKLATTTIDLFVPRSESVTFGLSAVFYRYEDPEKFFSSSFHNTRNAALELLGSTLQSLPRASAGFQLIWDLGDENAFLPRYQATEAEASRTWSHTLNLGWEHRFSPNWVAVPTYEATLERGELFSGLALALSYTM